MRSQSAWPQTILLATAVNLSSDSNLRLPSNIKRPDTFWTVKFVATNTHQVNITIVHAELYFSYTLSGVSMEKNTFFSAKFSNFTNRLLDPDFIINMDDWKGECVGSDSRSELIHVNYTVGLNG